MPPKTAWMRSPVACPSSRASSAICATSSRVGAITSARGAAALSAARGRASRRVKIVMRNAAVLPVPVCACPATSRPASASGSTFSWMGVQRTKPAARMPARTASGSGNASKGRPSVTPDAAASAGTGSLLVTPPTCRPSPGVSTAPRACRSRATRVRTGSDHGGRRATGAVADHARLRGAPVRRGARASAGCGRAGRVGQQPARRPRPLPHLRPADHGRRGAGHPAPPRPAGHGALGTAMGARELDLERRLPVLTGRAWTFADGLAAADILPLRCAQLDAGAAAAHLFADLDAGLAAAVRPGDVLVAGARLGHGPGGAAAAAALAAAGMIAVVAQSFADDFAARVLAAGLAPLEVDAPSVFRTGQRL